MCCLAVTFLVWPGIHEDALPETIVCHRRHSLSSLNFSGFLFRFWHKTLVLGYGAYWAPSFGILRGCGWVVIRQRNQASFSGSPVNKNVRKCLWCRRGRHISKAVWTEERRLCPTAAIKLCTSHGAFTCKWSCLFGLCALLWRLLTFALSFPPSEVLGWLISSREVGEHFNLRWWRCVCETQIYLL